MDPSQQRAAEIFLTYHDFVMHCAFRFAPAPDLADDIIQDTFHEFVRNFHRLTIPDDVRPLLLGITRNIALRHWQRRQRERSKTVRLIGEYFREIADHRTVADDSGQRDWYRREMNVLELCLDKVPPRGRELLLQYYYQGKKIAEIASQQGKSAEGMKQYLFRLRNKLRECIDRFVKHSTEK